MAEERHRVPFQGYGWLLWRVQPPQGHLGPVFADRGNGRPPPAVLTGILFRGNYDAAYL